ncbi:hypothetical protein R1flu_023144 [Riccia fluitans]|uniref:Uncharacterized protein n=1 Tax=Riccia fluitans TaxID=41844 RepID=A0ABD1XR71_9MARC
MSRLWAEFAKHNEMHDGLKDQMRKEAELKQFRKTDAACMKNIHGIKRKSMKLDKALKEMPCGLVVTSEVHTSGILKKGGSFNISLFPPMYVN